MTTEIIISEPKKNAVQVHEWTPDQIHLIKTQVAPGCTNDELQLFLYQANRTGLDPLSKQLYAIRRKSKNQNGQYEEKMTIQTSIDGYRLIAERTKKYAGQLGPWWCGKDGKWLDVWLSSEPPMAAKVSVLRSDFQEPLTAVALWGSYVQTFADGNPTMMWRKMATLMIAKCAEALALRKAFPQELSGVYTEEEMAQAEKPPSPPQTQPAPIPAPLTLTTPKVVVPQVVQTTATSEGMWNEAELAEEQNQNLPASGIEVIDPNEPPTCCGKPMFISKFKHPDFGELAPFYCLNCKKKVKRA